MIYEGVFVVEELASSWVEVARIVVVILGYSTDINNGAVGNGEDVCASG